MLPGPLGPLCVRANPGEYSRIRRWIFKYFCRKRKYCKVAFWHRFIFSRIELASAFLKKIIFPPLRTKPYYSKPKWSPRRPKSLKMRKRSELHILCDKSHFWLQKCVWGQFSHFGQIMHFRVLMTQKGIKEPLLPQAFEPSAPILMLPVSKSESHQNWTQKATFY